jgi:cobalamin biosynthesis protein CobT
VKSVNSERRQSSTIESQASREMMLKDKLNNKPSAELMKSLDEIDHTIFDKARTEIFNLMETDSFIRFKRTREFEELEQKHQRIQEETMVLAELVRK